MPYGTQVQTTVEEELYAIHWNATVACMQNGLETDLNPYWMQPNMRSQPLPIQSSSSSPPEPSEYPFPSSPPAPPARPTLESRSMSTPSGRTCSNCHTTTTPLWRRCPDTRSVLCNACGLYALQHNKRRPTSLSSPPTLLPTVTPSSSSSCATGVVNQCSHCLTQTTSVWRRHNETGALLCNACGVYSRLRGKERPLSLKKDRVIPRATRKASESSGTGEDTVWIIQTP